MASLNVGNRRVDEDSRGHGQKGRRGELGGRRQGQRHGADRQVGIGLIRCLGMFGAKQRRVEDARSLAAWSTGRNRS